ncbi:hypothetical protein [Algoriphagus aquimarinus]|uniref:Uncharacterized protein n=1 Tax=Algoriphagus aquimarinus TaxID=237018 RepID=A0A1I1BKF6_9BACT|nr:hypothetical protein [Algoriphagus aquimarinus]SFB50741.1 hypothetical protein SAMN04489723_114102 [Algoriphagus aquimarinus]
MKNDYLYSRIYSQVEKIKLAKQSTYIFGHSPEDRSLFPNDLKLLFPDVNFIRIEEIDKETICDANDGQNISLRSTSQILGLLTNKISETLYIDVTGLDNRICAALIKNAINNLGSIDFPKNVIVIYAEPSTYNIKQFKAESVFNDLSEKIEGIEPLPGFATIVPNDEDDTLLVALLGFEGGRFTHMIENVQPLRENIIPIIGVPGFRLEYPYVAYWGNRRPLEETDTWRKVKFVAANSMVDIFMLLSKLHKKNPSRKIKLAPIGTKPHAIGAMLFAIRYPYNVELVYDNPKKKIKRTEGIGNIVECEISKLILEN